MPNATNSENASVKMTGQAKIATSGLVTAGTLVTPVMALRVATASTVFKMLTGIRCTMMRFVSVTTTG
jgi:hypothetical protein